MKTALRWIVAGTALACAAWAAAQTLPFISEETPAAFCDPGFAIVKLQCRGHYCDDIRATCERYATGPGTPSTATYWTKWFSEERSGEVIQGSNFPKLTEPYSLAVGIQCGGRYCDNLRLLMVPVKDPHVASMDAKDDGVGPNCRVSTVSFSEEAGANVPLPVTAATYREFMHRVGCSGRYCDNLRMEWCTVHPGK